MDDQAAITGQWRRTDTTDQMSQKVGAGNRSGKRSIFNHRDKTLVAVDNQRFQRGDRRLWFDLMKIAGHNLADRLLLQTMIDRFADKLA